MREGWRGGGWGGMVRGRDTKRRRKKERKKEEEEEEEEEGEGGGGGRGIRRSSNKRGLSLIHI